ncbi:MAG: helix-turn-helix domain-containing protein [bacterium]
MSDRPVASNSTPDGPGVALAKAREAADITQREVSDALNLPVSTIAAIEQDDREHLPADVFTRGYIRAYARLLQLDPGPLVAAFGGGPDANERSAASAAQTAAGENPTGRGSGTTMTVRLPAYLTPVRLLVGGGLLLLLIILAVWFFATDTPPEPDSKRTATSASTDASMAAAADSTPPATTPLINVPVETSRAEGATSLVADESVMNQAAVAANTIADAPLTAQNPVPEAQETVAQPESESAVVLREVVQSVTPPGARRLTPSGDERLSIEFTEECWVEIKDTEGNLLYGNLGRPGTLLEFVGKGPFRVLLGYAPGVMLKYNAEPVALGPHTRNNVASLVLGQ